MTLNPVHIVGAGIGGLALGRCLLRRGVPAVLFEKASSGPRNSYAITLHASFYRPLLQCLGIDENTFRSRVAVERNAGTIDHTASTRHDAAEQVSFRAHRGKLEQLLSEGLDIRWEQAIEEVESGSDGGLLLRLQSGQAIDSHCVIGADGPHSITRKSMLSSTEPKVLPFVAFNGRRRLTPATFDSLYATAMKETNVIDSKIGNALLNISLIEKTNEHVNVSWTYSRPSRGPSDNLYKPNRPTSGAKDIPEEFYAEMKGLQVLTQPFQDMFDEAQLRNDRTLHWLMRSILVGLSDLQGLGKRGIFFMGDSIHAEPIIGGHGANVAITDAVQLADCISQQGQAGISKWYSDRYPQWEEGVARSEELIAKMHAD